MNRHADRELGLPNPRGTGVFEHYAALEAIGAIKDMFSNWRQDDDNVAKGVYGMAPRLGCCEAAAIHIRDGLEAFGKGEKLSFLTYMLAAKASLESAERYGEVGLFRPNEHSRRNDFDGGLVELYGAVLDFINLDYEMALDGIVSAQNAFGKVKDYTEIWDEGGEVRA